jgi:hypothetical protein
MVKIFDVMLEGKEGNMGYYITYTVSGTNKEIAIENACNEANRNGLEITQIEEVELIEVNGDNIKSNEILKISGKSFFNLD